MKSIYFFFSSKRLEALPPVLLLLVVCLVHLGEVHPPAEDAADASESFAELRPFLRPARQAPAGCKSHELTRSHLCTDDKQVLQYTQQIPSKKGSFCSGGSGKRADPVSCLLHWVEPRLPTIARDGRDDLGVFAPQPVRYTGDARQASDSPAHQVPRQATAIGMKYSLIGLHWWDGRLDREAKAQRRGELLSQAFDRRMPLSCWVKTYVMCTRQVYGPADSSHEICPIVYAAPVIAAPGTRTLFET